MSDDLLFDVSDDELLISVYQKQARTLDDLPYTTEFEAIHGAMVGESDDVDSRARLFRRLHNLRKAGKLPRLGRASDGPPRIDREHELILEEVVESEIERLSLRDQLPYTLAFDRIVHAFNARAGLNLSPHDVWRVVAKLAK